MFRIAPLPAPNVTDNQNVIRNWAKILENLQKNRKFAIMILKNNNICDILLFMDDLHVTHYDAKEVDTKKQSLVKRATAAGGAIVLSLSLFNLTGCLSAGGGGAWFNSCTADECECTVCECANDECTEVK